MNSSNADSANPLGSRRATRLRPEQIDQAAQLLLAARAMRRAIAPPFAIPTTEDAYAIQDAVAASLGPIGGWKVGAKGPQAQPTAAPILASGVKPSPATIPASSLGVIGIEAEIAFSLARDVAPGEPLDDAALARVIAAAHPAIEVVDTRIADWRNADKLWLLADNQMNAALVHGAAAQDWARRRFTEQPVELSVNGQVVARAIGGNPAGDPWRVLKWVVNHCQANRVPLAAGTVITTGSCTGMIFVEPGSRVEARFAGFGEAAVDFSA
jgi:2-keto-4-pentenoate hydratase